MQDASQFILVQQNNGVLTVTMNRPEKLNAFHDEMIQEFSAAIDFAAREESVRCLIITGAGKAFGAGQDLSIFLRNREHSEPASASEHLQKYHHIVQTLQHMDKPTIAALHGAAAGISLNIALACDLRIAADNVRISEAFARIGLVPDGGGAYFLPRLVGLSKALEMALLADEIDGPEAERLGLVNKCVPLADLQQTVSALAQRLAQGPTQTYGLIKQLMYSSLTQDLQGVFDLECTLQMRALESLDHQEGVAAFLQKRLPNYSGK